MYDFFRDAPESPSVINRNHCPRSNEMGVRDHRNMQPLYLGKNADANNASEYHFDFGNTAIKDSGLLLVVNQSRMIRSIQFSL